jgi:hypothetical protein
MYVLYVWIVRDEYMVRCRSPDGPQVNAPKHAIIT